jgi:hypothetical protein
VERKAAAVLMAVVVETMVAVGKEETMVERRKEQLRRKRLPLPVGASSFSTRLPAGLQRGQPRSRSAAPFCCSVMKRRRRRRTHPSFAGLRIDLQIARPCWIEESRDVAAMPMMMMMKLYSEEAKRNFGRLVGSASLRPWKRGGGGNGRGTELSDPGGGHATRLLASFLCW